MTSRISLRFFSKSAYVPLLLIYFSLLTILPGFTAFCVLLNLNWFSINECATLFSLFIACCFFVSQGDYLFILLVIYSIIVRSSVRSFISFNPFSPKSVKFKIEEKTNSTNNKQHHMKVLLNSFYLNGHTLKFHLQTQKYNHIYRLKV